MGAAMNVTATGGWRTGAAAPSVRAVTILPAGRRCRQPRQRAARLPLAAREGRDPTATR